MQCDLTISELFKAYYDCRKTKRNTYAAIEFEENLERNLMDLYYELTSGKYQPGKSIMFVVLRPKPREVWASCFRDRIVHHLLYNRYSKKFHNRFIHDSFACIPGKGTLNAANRVQHFVRSATQNNKNHVWFLKMDIANFFVSIDKKILDAILSKQIIDPWWRWLMRTILHCNPSNNVFIKSKPGLLKLVPKHKSLLNSKPGYGLPIGNLSSQFFANVYLNELDQFVKQTLKIKRYARYVDDLIIILEHNPFLTMLKISEFVEENLNIKFHPNKTQINKVDKGINFVGFIIKPHCKYIRQSTIKNCEKIDPLTCEFVRLRSSINSYFGMLKHANAYNSRKRLARKFSKFGCKFDKNFSKIISQGVI